MNITSLNSSQSSSGLSPEICKAALFKVADHWFALPATAIIKVIPSSVLEKGEAKLAVWNNCPLIRLDLNSLLSRQTVLQSEEKQQSTKLQSFTMIVWSQTGEYCGISVEQLPILHDISLSRVQVLPLNYRRMIHNLAKYMVIQSYHGTALNILLLDLQQALSIV